MKPFRERYTFQERVEKCKKQAIQNPEKIVLIAEKHPKSRLPDLKNPRFLCDRSYKFNMVKSMLAGKITEREGKPDPKSKTTSFFVYIHKKIPNGEQSMSKIYDKFKDEDGFLYLQYGEMQTFGQQ